MTSGMLTNDIAAAPDWSCENSTKPKMTLSTDASNSIMNEISLCIATIVAIIVTVSIVSSASGGDATCGPAPVTSRGAPAGRHLMTHAVKNTASRSGAKCDRLKFVKDKFETSDMYGMLP